MTPTPPLPDPAPSQVVERPKGRARRVSAIRLSEELHAEVKAAAAERGMSMNDLVRIALEDVLPRLLPAAEIRWTRPLPARPGDPQGAEGDELR